MPQLLLELFSEEIPARMQAGAARDLERMARDGLARHELAFESLRTFAGPRRLTLVMDGLPAATPDRSEELKGPKASAPPQALDGFLRKTGLTRDQLSEREGVFYAAIQHPGRPTPQIAAELVGEIMRGFPWPKSMRSGSSNFRWVRPLKRIVFLFDGAVVPFEIDGVASADVTEGHRFLGPDAGKPITVRDFADYQKKLSSLGGGYVVIDAAERRETILRQAQAECQARGLELVPDEGLADEVAGLVEWPVPLIGDMNPDFLDLPGEVIRTSMRTHQKYFAVRRAGETALAPHFVVVANVIPSDGGAEIRAGNAKVLSARLSDARFFWDEDRKAGAFDRWLEKLKGVTFHAKLGTMAERVERIAVLAREIAPAVGADPDLAETAARLAKADLASAMVGEFPELQGVMGGYYVRQAPHSPAASPLPPRGGEAGRGGGDAVAVSPPSQEGAIAPATPIPDPSPLKGEGRVSWWTGLSPEQVDAVADAVRDHYKPVGPSDSVPTAPLTVAVALADKLDTLVGFFAIDEKPTGSKDPYALRRAALGVIRLILSAGRAASLRRISSASYMELLESLARARALRELDSIGRYYPIFDVAAAATKDSLFVNLRCVQNPAMWTHPDTAQDERRPEAHAKLKSANELQSDLLAFFADRLKVLLRDEGKRHDLVDAVFALGDDDLVRIVDRVEALSAFLATEDGANLLAGYKRTANILRAEQKKNPGDAYPPLPLDGGEAGRGGAGTASDSRARAAPPESDADRLATTPIPDPSPIKGEGSALEEQTLLQAIRKASAAMQPLLAAEDFAAAMGQLARLRAPVDAFFDKVLVNDPDPAVRMNRLRLLASLQATANQVADFSLIQG